MILAIHSEKNIKTAEVVSVALASYFEEILINAAGNAANFQLQINDNQMILTHNEANILELSAPYRLGKILNAIQNSIQNSKIKQQSCPIIMGQNILNPHTKILARGSKDIRLTDKEFDIIYALYVASPTKIPRDVLLHQIWGYGDGIETHTLETHIYRLRQKIEKDGGNPDFLKTDDDGYYLNF